MVIRAPSFPTLAIAVLLLFQAFVYANAAWAGAAAEGIHITPLRRAYRNSAQSTGIRPSIGAETLAIPTALVLAGLLTFLLVSLAAPTPPSPPENPLPNVLAGPAKPSPSATPTPPSSPVPSASPSASASPSPKPSASPLPSASPSPS
jgi:hypothetical protein